jgi:fructose-1,6-bisphosphatase
MNSKFVKPENPDVFQDTIEASHYTEEKYIRNVRDDSQQPKRDSNSRPAAHMVATLHKCMTE